MLHSLKLHEILLDLLEENLHLAMNDGDKRS